VKSPVHRSMFLYLCYTFFRYFFFFCQWKRHGYFLTYGICTQNYNRKDILLTFTLNCILISRFTCSLDDFFYKGSANVRTHRKWKHILVCFKILHIIWFVFMPFFTTILKSTYINVFLLEVFKVFAVDIDITSRPAMVSISWLLYHYAY
jgi:hypothetical protein